MSYARWSDSHWYAFACESGLCFMCADERDLRPGNPDFGLRDCLFPADMYFTPAELQRDLDGCVARLRRANKSASETDMTEAKAIMTQFLQDVEGATTGH